MWTIYCLESPIDFGWEKLNKSDPSEMPPHILEYATCIGSSGSIIEFGSFIIPDSELVFMKGYAWKEVNNGTTFIASPFELPHLKSRTYGSFTTVNESIECLDDRQLA